MSDIDRQPAQHAPAPIAHRCHCGDWAGFGFSPPGRRQEMQWWCWKHYLHRDADTRLETGMVAELLAS
ncbi:hypothetical protein EV561_13044 [Rhizobium sp. BK376]|nr:hypothetical protein EV561_13044 [Rhizobium sp. BK376]